MKKWILLMVIISVLRSFSLNAQDSSKKMEQSARNAYKELLKETDKNKDGKISKTEFYAIWKDKKSAEEKFKFWDLNKDGFITEEEYVKAVLSIGKKKK
jgi:Ca2+-binding EF-hand superfamily protein